jgi:hypothetical protein
LAQQIAGGRDVARAVQRQFLERAAEREGHCRLDKIPAAAGEFGQFAAIRPKGNGVYV